MLILAWNVVCVIKIDFAGVSAQCMGSEYESNNSMKPRRSFDTQCVIRIIARLAQAMLYRIPCIVVYKNKMNTGMARNDIKSICQNEE